MYGPDAAQFESSTIEGEISILNSKPRKPQQSGGENNVENVIVIVIQIIKVATFPKVSKSSQIKSITYYGILKQRRQRT